MRSSTLPRVARYRLGLQGEWFAAFCLRLKGYRIVAKRLRTPVGEIDLIARRGRVLAIVEVKARATLADAAAAISVQQQERLSRAARFAMTQPFAAGCETVRCDAMLVAPFAWPRHLENAFAAP